MDLPLGWHLSIEDRPSPAARNRLGRELGKHNRPYLRNAEMAMARRLCPGARWRHRRGLAGSTYGDWLFIHDLWVRADLRRRGIGQELLRLAEGRARERGCHSAWLDTDDWADGDRRRGGVKRMQAFARNCRNQSL
jgi:GNAT superfamily N-acetyltransferase